MSNLNKENFGEYLKYLRELRDISITQLAKLSRVSPSYISRIENGGRRAPKPDILKRMAPHLGIGYTELMVKAGYLTKQAENLWIEDEETKDLFVSLTEGKKELLRAVDGLSEDTIFLLVTVLKNIMRETTGYKEEYDETEEPQTKDQDKIESEQ